MKCTRCNGKGHLDETIIWSEHTYIIICPKCCARKELDWVQSITGIKCNVVEILTDITNLLLPENYIFVFRGTTYFIRKKFFSHDLENRVKGLSVHMTFLRDNPNLLKCWR